MKKYIVKGDFHPTSATGGTAGTSLAISAGAVTVTLIPSTYVIDYSKVGNESTTVSFTTVSFNMEGTVFYEFLVGATSKQNSTTSTFTLADSDEPGPTDAPIKVTVKVRQGTNNGTLIAQDTVSIYSVQDGQSTVTGLLTNEAHTVATNNDGTGASFTGAGGTFKVFYGNTDITTNAKTVFSVSSETGVDVSINSSTGVYTVSSMSADTGTAIFSCEVEGSLIDGVDNQNDVTITKTYTIARAKTGTTGDAGQANAIVYAYQRSASALTSNPGAVTVSLEGTTSGTITTGSLANGWSKTIPVGTNPLYVCAATAAGTGSTDTIAANEWSSPVVLAQGETGVNSATVFLYQNNNTGNAPSNLPSGNATYTFATSSLGSFATNANGWSTTNPGVTDSNRYLWVTTATAAANTATDIIADSEWATIKLLAQKGDDGAAGAAGLTGLLTNENASATYYGGIGLNVYSIVNYSSTGGEFKVFEGASEKTSGVVYTITGGSSSGGSTTKTQNGLTLTINQSTGVYIASGNSWTTEKEEFTLTGTIGSTVITKVYNIDRKLAFTTTELTASAQTFSYDKDSANPSPSTITLTASVPFNFSFFTSYTYQYQFSKSTDNGANFSVVQSWSTTRTLSVSAGAFSLGNEVFKVEVRSTFLNTTVLDSDQQTLIRIKEGDTGQQGIQGVEGDDGASNFTIFQESASQPSTPSAGTSNPPTSSWYSTVTAARNAVSGNGLVWFSVGTKPGTSTTITWSEPIRYIELYDQIGGTKPPEDANKFLTIADAVEGRMRFSINGGTTTDYDIFTSGERTKLDRLRLGRIPTSDTVLLENTTDSQTKATAAETAAKLQESTNRVTFPSNTTEGQFTFRIGSTDFSNNVFSSAERTKLDNLRNGKTPGNAALSIINSETTASNVGLGNVTNESKATMFAAPTFTGTVSGVSKTHVGLSNVDNTSDATILAGDLTGSVNGTAVATIKSGAAAGATANQDSTSTILGGTHTGDLSGTIGGVANATIRGGVSRANSAIDSSNRLVADFHDGTTTFSRAELFRVRDGFDNISSGTLTLKTANLPTVPVNKGGTGVSDSALFLNSELDTADITGAGGVDASSLAYGEIASSSGSTATSWSHNGVAYSPTATTQTITLTIAHPTFGTSTVVGTWTRTNFQITNFSLGTGSGMSGSGNNNWTFGDVDSDSGSADNAFGSSTANYGTKTLYVQHSSSNKRVEITAFVLNLNFGGGGKCLTPAMLPENLQIGDEIDSPEGKTKVIDIQYKEREGYYILEDELEITNDHPILIDGEWILAEEYAGKKEYIDKPTEVVYVETENELLTVKDWTVGGKY